MITRDIKRYLKKLFNIGFLNTIRQVYNNKRFDKVREIDTMSVVYNNRMDYFNKDSYMYMTIEENLFLAICQKIGSEFKTHFIDYGSGKGKVLIMAKEFGFKQVVGIELSEFLFKVSKNNVNKLNYSDITVLNKDARLYDLPINAKTLFLYNPFSGVVLDAVLSQILDYHKIHNQKLLLIYVNPMYSEIFEARKIKKIDELTYLDNKAYFYILDGVNI
jgi:SAM-dependent methyltransferase